MLMQYWILKGSSLVSLTEEVERAIYLGWKPQGGIAADENGYYQAVVKE